MGDISTERSMEDILSSIKRIIAEEGEGARIRRTPPPASETQAEPEPDSDDATDRAVLELADVADDGQETEMEPNSEVETTPESTESAGEPDRRSEEAILSERAAQATRGSLEALSRLIVKPEGSQANTLEGLVREMLRPMLSDWLDTHLPAVVEKIVQREIERITRR